MSCRQHSALDCDKSRLFGPIKVLVSLFKIIWLVSETKAVKTSNSWKVAWQKVHKIQIYKKASASIFGFSPWKAAKKRIWIIGFRESRSNEWKPTAFRSDNRKTNLFLTCGFEKLQGILWMKSNGVRTFWAYYNFRTGRRLRSSIQSTLTGYLSKPLARVSPVALESGLRIYACLRRGFWWLFQL